MASPIFKQWLFESLYLFYPPKFNSVPDNDCGSNGVTTARPQQHFLPKGVNFAPLP